MGVLRLIQPGSAGQTGHAEAVRIVYDPAVIRYEQLLQIFWENHTINTGDATGVTIAVRNTGFLRFIA